MRRRYKTSLEAQFANAQYNKFTEFLAGKVTMILIYMMVLCTQVNKMYVIATLSVYALRVAITYKVTMFHHEGKVILLTY